MTSVADPRHDGLETVVKNYSEETKAWSYEGTLLERARQPPERRTVYKQEFDSGLLTV